MRRALLIVAGLAAATFAAQVVCCLGVLAALVTAASKDHEDEE